MSESKKYQNLEIKFQVRENKASGHKNVCSQIFDGKTIDKISVGDKVRVSHWDYLVEGIQVYGQSGVTVKLLNLGSHGLGYIHQAKFL